MGQPSKVVLTSKDVDLTNELDIDLEDPEVDKAALKIQSSFRGHQARNKVKDIQGKNQKSHKRDDTNINLICHEEDKKQPSKASELDIDLEDPEVDKAALKIQS